MSSSPSPTGSGQELDALLPDYVRDRVSAGQRQAIEALRDRDARFAALLRHEQQLKLFFDEQRAAPVAAGSFAPLRRRLQQPTLAQRLHQWLQALTRLPGPAWASAAVIAAAIGIGLWMPAQTPQPAPAGALYQTLTRPSSAAPAGAEWRLVFAPGLAASAQQALLDEQALVALSAADAQGSVWVRGRKGGSAGLDVRLRGDARVAIAQPVSAPGRQP